MWRCSVFLRLTSVDHFLLSSSLDSLLFFSRSFPAAHAQIGRRYKIMNPEKMRGTYGKMMYLLQDAAHSKHRLAGPIHTVFTPSHPTLCRHLSTCLPAPPHLLWPTAPLAAHCSLPCLTSRCTSSLRDVGLRACCPTPRSIWPQPRWVWCCIRGPYRSIFTISFETSCLLFNCHHTRLLMDSFYIPLFSTPNNSRRHLEHSSVRIQFPLAS